MLFDIETLNSATFNKKVKSTYELTPPGEYFVEVEDPEFVALGERNSPALQLNFRILEGELKGDLIRRYLIWLDLDDYGDIKTGRNENLELGKFLDSVDLNGQSWTRDSLRANRLRINLIHQPRRSDPEHTDLRVNGWAKA